MGKSDPEVKSFDISKRLVWEAYKSVKANDGAAGVDGQSIEEFETDLKNNLYRIWNRMSSGTYFPPPVRAVEIPKPHGGGTRILGIPTVGDRIAQTVVALQLLPRMESIFHDDSYGYRPGRSPLMAVKKCRERCWKKDWILDLDVQKFFDSVDHDLMVKAVEANTDQKWVVLYVKRWLRAQCHGLQVDQGRWPAFRAGVIVRVSGCGALRVWVWPGCRSGAGGRFHVRLFRAGGSGRARWSGRS